MSEQPVEVEAEAPATEARTRTPGDWTAFVGILGVCAVAVAVVTGALAVWDASTGEYARATVLAWVAIASSIAAVLAGITALSARQGRGWGAIALVGGLLANPYLVMRVLDSIGGVAAN